MEKTPSWWLPHPGLRAEKMWFVLGIPFHVGLPSSDLDPIAREPGLCGAASPPDKSRNMDIRACQC